MASRFVGFQRVYLEGGSDAHSGFGDLTIATVLTRHPFGPRRTIRPYPVCLHVYQPWGAHYYDCSYTVAAAQCNASASAAPPCAVIIHILLAWKSPARVIGGFARSTKAYAI